MSVIISILIVAACLLFIICFHEFGHYVASRLAGVKVLEAGVGLPPRLIGFKKGDTLYSINAVPLGAFVRPEGENDPEVPTGLAAKSPWIRMGVSAAGPFANFLLAFILFSISLMLPVQILVGQGVRVHEVTAGSPAETAGIQAGDIITTIAGEEIHTSTDIGDAINSSEEVSEIDITVTRDGEAIPISVTPELNTDDDRYVIGVLMSQLGVTVDEVTEGSPAETAGIQTGDVILTFDGKRTYDMEDLSEALDSVEEGDQVKVQVQRSDELITIDNVTPELVAETGQFSIGIDGSFVETSEEEQSYPFFQAIAKGGEYLIAMPTLMVDAFTAMDGDYSDAVVGPVGVVQITGETTAYGFGAIIGLAGLISVGIGLFNLFPIPPLDGGGMLVAGIEGIRGGKRLSQKSMQLAYAIGAALLFTAFILITYNDILRLLRGDSVLP